MKRSWEGHPNWTERFHPWLLGNHWFGQYIKNYQQGQGISLRDKIVTLGAQPCTLFGRKRLWRFYTI